MALSREVPQVVLLAKDLESLKKEVAEHLTRLSIRQPKDITLISSKIPIHISGTVPPECDSNVSTIAFPLCGTLQDFFSYINGSTNGASIKISLWSCRTKQETVVSLNSGFSSYQIQADIKAQTVVSITVCNSTKNPIEYAIGFTFKETLPHEIKETQLNYITQ